MDDLLNLFHELHKLAIDHASIFLFNIQNIKFCLKILYGSKIKYMDAACDLLTPFAWVKTNPGY